MTRSVRASRCERTSEANPDVVVGHGSVDDHAPNKDFSKHGCMNFYQLLGVATDATADEIDLAYGAKMAQLQRVQSSGAPPDVAAAERRAATAFKSARATLSDAALRAQYDARLRVAGDYVATPPDKREGLLRRHAEHVWAMERELGHPLTSVFGLHPPSDDEPSKSAGIQGGGLETAMPDEEWLASPLYDPLADLEQVADWLAPHPGPSKMVTVPDVCGRHASEAFTEIALADLQIRFERLTANPAGTDGVVVGQLPVAGASVRRHSVVEVQVVHPEAQPVPSS